MNWLKEFICNFIHYNQHMVYEINYSNQGRKRKIECAACGRTWAD